MYLSENFDTDDYELLLILEALWAFSIGDPSSLSPSKW